MAPDLLWEISDTQTYPPIVHYLFLSSSISGSLSTQSVESVAQVEERSQLD